MAFDGDDTLWHSESYYVETESKFVELLSPWMAPGDVSAALLDAERANLPIFGYGIKGFTLSMVQTANVVSGGEVSASQIAQILQWGKEMLSHPVELIDGVAETLQWASGRYRLVLITKGDLAHQSAKVEASGLAAHFEAIEIVREKDPRTYSGVLDQIAVPAERFVMVGNSVRSDIRPVLEIGGSAIHVGHEHTWTHELVDHEPHHRMHVAESIRDVMAILRGSG